MRQRRKEPVCTQTFKSCLDEHDLHLSIVQRIFYYVVENLSASFPALYRISVNLLLSK